VIPDLLGGSETLMIGKTLWNEFNQNRDWPVSSAVATVLCAAGGSDHDLPALPGQGAGRGPLI
jgi:ABC-type spermidine/putrescine transport system permease subunit I